jgi:hypothetical protein
VKAIAGVVRIAVVLWLVVRKPLFAIDKAATF